MKADGVGDLRSRRVSLWGSEVAFVERDGPGPVVVLIHGLGSTHDTWRGVLDLLPEHYRVVAPDLPGHGDSAAGHGDHSVGAAAGTVRDLMAALDIRRATLIGHSFGGGVAMQFAYQFPDWTERIGLIGSAGLGAEVAAGLRATTALPGASAFLWGLSQIPAAFQRHLMRPATWWSGDPDEADAIAADLRRMRDRRHRRTFLQTARGVIDYRGQRVDAVSRMPGFASLPILMVWGERDPVIPPGHQRAAAAASTIPPDLAVEIPAAGHYPHHTHDAHVADLIARLVDTTSPYHHDHTAWQSALTGGRAILEIEDGQDP